MAVYLVFLVLIAISAAVLGTQIAERSTLALEVKQLFKLEQPYNKKLLALSRISTWWILLPRLFYVLLPLIVLLVLALRIHHFIADLLACSYCTTYHIAWTLLYFLLGLPLVWALCLAPLALLFVDLIYTINK